MTGTGTCGTGPVLIAREHPVITRSEIEIRIAVMRIDFTSLHRGGNKTTSGIYLPEVVELLADDL